MTNQQQKAASGTNYKKGFRIHLLCFVLSVPAVWLVWYLTDRTYPWALWQTLGWAVGILFHYLGVYVFRKSTLIHH